MTEYLHESIADEAKKHTVRFPDIPVGRRLLVTFGEGMDCADQARLMLELAEAPTQDSMAKFKVVSADLDEAILEANRRAGINSPEIMGGELWIDFACTYRQGYMPPISLAQKDALSAGRHMFGWIPNPTEENPEQGFQYHAEVLSLELSED